ncbi:MAG: NADH-quinone oxidoreductase subunit NuoF [Clostridiales bacterium]
MTRVKSLDDLKNLKKEAVNSFYQTNGEENKLRVVIGMATCGIAAGAKEVYDEIEEEVNKLNIKNVILVKSGCIGTCHSEPTVEIKNSNGESVLYGNISKKEAKEIVNIHLKTGKVLEDLVIKNPIEPSDMSSKGQVRIALRNCGVIEPEKIEEYISNDGYKALGMCVTKMTATDVINEIKESGLRGRGGGGFPTGIKWEATAKQDDPQKYIVCNADEGDPGAFMDRSILEGDPHSVLEAMVIAGYSVGANKGYIYIRAEYPLAVKRLKIAMKQAKDFGFLGEKIFNSDFSFDIEIRYGAGAFVCGEETSLINSIEGNRGEPRNKPPFPAESGLWNKPTVVNNVETFANISPIILNGAQWLKSIGTEKSSGTKVFALAGKVNNVGLVEIPMGTTLREIIFEIGGGIQDFKNIKSVQTGGPSGGCIPRRLLNTKIDYDNLISIGSMMGSGGMIVLDEDDCMVNIAKYYLEFTMDESCGKCTACRIGNKRIHEILSKVTSGRASMNDLESLRELSGIIKDTALCGLGQTSPNPVLSTLNHFWDEYVAHVEDKRCPSGVCKELIVYTIIEDKCVGCTACSRVCPAKCISGKVKKPHIIDQNKCIKCGACHTACKFDAIERQ